MVIKVDNPIVSNPEVDVWIAHEDMLMVKRIKNKGLYIDAIKVARFIAGCSLKSAKDFVDSL